MAPGRSWAPARGAEDQTCAKRGSKRERPPWLNMFSLVTPATTNPLLKRCAPPWRPGDISLSDDISQLATAFPHFRTSNSSGRLNELGYFSFRYFWDLDMTGGDSGGLGGGFNRDGAVYGGVPLLLRDGRPQSPPILPASPTVAPRFCCLAGGMVFSLLAPSLPQDTCNPSVPPSVPRRRRC